MLKGIFQTYPLDRGDAANYPTCLVGVNYKNHSSREFQCLIDTGAIVNLISHSLAKPLLGIEQNEIEAGRFLPIRGVGNEESRAYGFPVNLKMRATSASNSYFSMSGAWLYVSEKELPVDILFGQFGGLQGKSFFHLNGGRKPHWVLRNL